VKWMLDTDTCIAIIKKHPAALKKLRGKSIGQVGLSSITLGELAFGADKSSRPKDALEALREFLLALEIAAIIRLSEAASRRNARARLAFGRGQLSRMIFSISTHHGRSEPMMFTWVRLPAWGVGKAPKAQPPRTEPPLISTSGGSAPPALS